MLTIGFVGLGHMGNPMVHRLLSAGYKVKVYDVVPTAREALAKAGAIAVTTLAEVAREAAVIITMLQVGEQVKQVCMGKEGLFAHAAHETIFIESSTIDVATSRELHTMAKEVGFAMLDAPVSGGVASAEAGTLTFMVGGKEKIYEQMKPLLSTMGKNIIYAGADGNGQVAKICNNMILGISMIAVSEAFTLAERLGLDAKKFFEISSHASGECWAMTHYSPVPDLVENVPANRGYKPGFAAKMMLKDLGLSQQAAHAVQAKTPLGAKANSLYEQFVAAGNAEVDFSAIIKLLKSD